MNVVRDVPGCASCRFFSAAPPDIESQLPGLRILSSAYAAVRSDDGLCRYHERYIAASSICEAFAPAARASISSEC
jgi:hypothetical protein